MKAINNGERLLFSMRKIITALIEKLTCFFMGHDDRHTEMNRDNQLRMLMPATKTCNRCGRFVSEKI